MSWTLASFDKPLLKMPVINLAIAMILILNVLFNGTNVALTILLIISILPTVQSGPMMNLDKFRGDE